MDVRKWQYSGYCYFWVINCPLSVFCQHLWNCGRSLTLLDICLPNFCPALYKDAFLPRNPSDDNSLVGLSLNSISLHISASLPELFQSKVPTCPAQKPKTNKPLQYCKVISLQLIKINENKQTNKKNQIK